ncbi:ciliary-associated calcium-binding coiled-coil protein 1 isoform X2 [Aplysia californica]|nr:ciliary-associated calcium-binding coiled-coil protein 1 isoform X2 [Aplysia californica]XP_035826951.1 ciliary-associated calcium-binding coiled-coil protein 1 isoform X2 [Aplysia californica]
MDALEMESKLQQTFQLNPSTDLKDAAVLDYYVGATYWCKQQGYSAQQLSGFFTVAHSSLEKVKDQPDSLVDTFKEFRKMLVGISAEPGPDVESGGLEFFNADQAKSIADYLHSSLFQHFKLYEFMFHHSQSMEIVGSDLSVEVPLPAETPFPPPLDEGISESTYKEFLTIPTPSLSSTEEGKTAEEEVKPATPIQVELPPEVEDIFNKLTPEDVRSVVEDVSSELLQSLQAGVEQKMRQYENNMLSRINKIHVVLPEPVGELEAAEK